MPEERVPGGGTADLLRGGSKAEDRRLENRTESMRGSDTASTRSPSEQSESTPLLDQDKLQSFRDRWEDSQRQFVDEPRKSVESADQLVADLVRQLAEQFATERSRLESQWDRGEQVSTDELRVAFQRYRAFFNRLLEV